MKPAPHLVSIPGIWQADHVAEWTSRFVDAVTSGASSTSMAWAVHGFAGLTFALVTSVFFWHLLRGLLKLAIAFMRLALALIDWFEAALVLAGAYVAHSVKRPLRGMVDWLQKILGKDD